MDVCTFALSLQYKCEICYEKSYRFLCAPLLMAACSHPGVRMSFEGFENDSVVVVHAAIDDLSKITSDNDPLVLRDTFIMQNGKVEFAADPERAQQYVCLLPEGEYPIMFLPHLEKNWILMS